MTQTALQGMPDARSEDRGDGFLTVVPPNVSTARVIDQLLKELPAALDLHNSTQRGSARFKLRLPLTSDPWSATPWVFPARRSSSRHGWWKRRTSRRPSPGAQAAWASSHHHSSTRLSSGTAQTQSDVASYSQVPVEVKESDTTAWMKLFDAPLPSSFVPHPAAPSLISAINALLPSRISRCEQALQPGQGFPEVGLGGQVARRRAGTASAAGRARSPGGSRRGPGWP